MTSRFIDSSKKKKTRRIFVFTTKYGNNCENVYSRGDALLCKKYRAAGIKSAILSTNLTK